MGMGNLQSVLRAYGERTTSPTRSSTSTRRPLRHAAAYAKLASFGDDSSNYCGSSARRARSCACSRDDRTASSRGSRPLQTAKNSAEEVLHPPGSTPRFATPATLQAGVGRRADRRVPARRQRVTGLRARRAHGRAGGGSTSPTLYRGPAPRGARHRALHRRRRCARSRGAVAADRHLDRARRASTSAGSCARNREATRNYSLHTTGWAFDIARRYRSQRQALAFQFVLDRLQVLDAIAWVREPGAIHVTAAPEAKALLPLLDRVQPAG